MEEERLKLLQGQQIRMLTENKANVDKYTEVRDEYEYLISVLDTLPDTVTKPAMVPMGKKAFMKGRIVHTNEVLVLLGDNWFAERSAKQAKEIAERRLEKCRRMLKDLEEERKLVQNWMSKSQEGEEGVEIREEFDEEEDKRWRIEHKEALKKQREMEKKEKKKEEKHEDDEDLWRRLDELEMEEELEEHLQRQHRLQDDDEDDDEGSSDWSESPGLTDDEESEEEEDDDDIKVAQKRKKSVTFEQEEEIASKVLNVKFTSENPEPEKGVMKSASQMTPSDLLEMIRGKDEKEAKKSILKPFKSEDIRVKEDLEPRNEEGRRPFVDPVMEVVVEREIGDDAEKLEEKATTTKISRFKKSRMKN